MRITPSEAATPARAAPEPAPLAARISGQPASAQVTLTMSSAMRAYATSLASPSSDGCPRFSDLLTQADRGALVQAYRVVLLMGLDVQELDRLVLDLAGFRALGAEAPSSARGVRRRVDEPGCQPSFAHGCPAQSDALLPALRLRPLPQFNARDEGLARAMLQHLNVAEPPLDRAFLGKLFDPFACPEHAVDFGFLRKLLLAGSRPLPAEQRQGMAWLERRDAQRALGVAVDRLVPTLTLQPEQVTERWTRAAVLMIKRLLVPRQHPASEGAAPGAAGLHALRPLVHLSRADRTLLRVLYAAADAQGVEPARIDALAQALAGWRRIERPSPATAAGASTSLAITAQRPSVPPHAQQALGASEQAGHAKQSAEQASQPGPREAEPSRQLPSAALPTFVQAQESGARDGLAGFAGAHRAARSADAYGSLAPPAPWPRAGSEGATAQSAVRQQPLLSGLLGGSTQQTHTAAPPLDLVQALGVAGLMAELRARQAKKLKQRVRRGRALARSNPNHREELSNTDASLDDARDGRSSRGRTRWLLHLARQRKRLRS